MDWGLLNIYFGLTLAEVVLGYHFFGTYLRRNAVELPHYLLLLAFFWFYRLYIMTTPLHSLFTSSCFVFFALSIAFFFYQGAWQNKFLVAWLYIFSHFTCRALLAAVASLEVINLFAMYYTSWGLRLVPCKQIAVSLAFLTCLAGLIGYRRKRLVTKLKIADIGITLVPFIVLSAAFFLCGSFQTFKLLGIGALNYIFTALLFFITALGLLHLLDKNYSLETTQKQISGLKIMSKAAQQHCNFLAAEHKNTRALRHDLKHHMQYAQHLLVCNKSKEALHYLGSLADKYLPGKKNVQSGNLLVDGVLNNCLHSLRQDCKLQQNILLPELLPFEDIDLTSLFSNLTANAVEALNRLPAAEEKALWIKTAILQQQFVILLQNTYNGELKYAASGYQTVKEDGHEATGLANVQNIVEKYKGIIKIEPTAHIFKVVVLLPLPSQSVSSAADTLGV